MTAPNRFLSFPLDLINYTFQFLDGKSLARCEQVCRGWRTRINNNPDLWRITYNRENADFCPRPTLDNWKIIYKRSFLIKKNLRRDQSLQFSINAKNKNCISLSGKLYVLEKTVTDYLVLRIYSMATGSFLKGCVFGIFEKTYPVVNDVYDEYAAEPIHKRHSFFPHKIKRLPNDHFCIYIKNHLSIWNAQTDVCIFSIFHNLYPMASNGKVVAFPVSEHSIEVWDIETKKLLRTIQNLDKDKEKMKIIGDFLLLHTKFSQILTVCDLQTGIKLYDKSYAHSGIEFGDQFFSIWPVQPTTHAEIYKLATGQLVKKIPMTIRHGRDLCSDCNFLQSKDYVYGICSTNNQLARWDLCNGCTPEYFPEIPIDHMRTLFVSQNRLIVHSWASSEFYSFEILDLSSGTLIKKHHFPFTESLIGFNSIKIVDNILYFNAISVPDQSCRIPRERVQAKKSYMYSIELSSGERLGRFPIDCYHEGLSIKGQGVLIGESNNVYNFAEHVYPKKGYIGSIMNYLASFL